MKLTLIATSAGQKLKLPAQINRLKKSINEVILTIDGISFWGV